MDKILEIKNLRVSFRTNDGTVKAVRDISLELNKGETLAVVGESGSGKSVSAKAVMGILAPNSIVESGEIIFDGKDLLKITEDEFHEYRGNNISMIFQDPMSSLNPIIRIGQQLTEAMLLNGKTNQKKARKEFDLKLRRLTEAIGKATGDSSAQKTEIFKKFTYEGMRREKDYNAALENAREAIVDIQNLPEDLSKMEPRQAKEEIKAAAAKAARACNDYVVVKSAQYDAMVAGLLEAAKGYTDRSQAASVLKKADELKAALEKAAALPKPDFFSMGYYVMSRPGEPVAGVDIPTLNQKMADHLKADFLDGFVLSVAKGMEYSHKNALHNRRELAAKLREILPAFSKQDLDRGACNAAAKTVSKAADAAIDPLAIRKDSMLYTLRTSILGGVKTYFDGIPMNRKETLRYQKEMKARQAQLDKGKIAENVVPAVIVDLDMIQGNMQKIIVRLIETSEEMLESADHTDYTAMALEMIEYLRAKASASVYKVTKGMAKTRAIRLMEEVGIPNPRERYMQFPFQFSGGMRQRIVIAIGLAANPDILICDEPTTALDVTIQAQILELVNRLKEERGVSVIFITHDLGVVANMADRVAVMYAGKIVEYGTTDEIFYSPKHPYTWALLASMPDLESREKLEAIPGTPPNMVRPPAGDAFAARNKYAMQIDLEEEPPMFEVTPTHYAATWLLHPDAPKVDPPKIVTDRIERMKNLEVAGNV